MSKQPNAAPRDSSTPPSPPDTKVDNAALLLIGDIGDTTWRMFVPTVGLTIVGLYLDTLIATKPWMMILGIIIGAAVAWLLVKRQLDRINKRT